jgi:hypothetical protein
MKRRVHVQGAQILCFYARNQQHRLASGAVYPPPPPPRTHPPPQLTRPTGTPGKGATHLYLVNVEPRWRIGLLAVFAGNPVEDERHTLCRKVLPPRQAAAVRFVSAWHEVPVIEESRGHGDDVFVAAVVAHQLGQEVRVVRATATAIAIASTRRLEVRCAQCQPFKKRHVQRKPFGDVGVDDGAQLFGVASQN